MTPESKKVQEYRRTVPGLVTLIYSNQKTTSKKYGRPPPTYTKAELRRWLENHPDFTTLFNDWVASGYDRQLSPSVDRVSNKEGYSFHNIQLTTCRQNVLNQKAQNKDGTYLHTGSKAVHQISLEGHIIKTHPSIACAMRELTGKRGSVSNISNVCDGVWHTAYGFRWEWA